MPSRPSQGPDRRGKALAWALSIAMLAALGAGIWWRTHHQNGDAGQGFTKGQGGSGGGSRGNRGAGRGGQGPQPVSVQPVTRRDIRVIVNAIGNMTAANTATVRVQVSGVLQNLLFKEGQQVKAGQPLAQIDPRSFQATLSQAEGAFARDKAQLDNARVELARDQALLAQDAIARQDVDAQQAQVRQLEGTLRADQAAVESARLQLSYTHVAAPIPGRTGLKQSDIGNVVNPGDANGIVTITQTRPIAMVFAVPCSVLPKLNGRLRANEPVLVEAWDEAGAAKLAGGRVALVDNAIDPSTDTIRVKALFPNEDDALFPNQAVSVRMQLDTLPHALAVPQAAVLKGAQGFYVYVVGDDGTVSSRVIKPGPADDGWMAVEGQLREGESVVTDGVDRLRDGAKVEVITAEARQRAGMARGGGKDSERGHGRRSHGQQEAGASAAGAASSQSH